MGMFAGRGYKTRLLNPIDEVWDRRLGVHTFGYRPASGSEAGPDWRLHYTPATYRNIFFLLKYVGLTSEDVFTDLGSGMGRVVFAASWLGAKRSMGVEILPDLCEISKENKRRSILSDRNISFVCENAKDADLSGTTVLFIFHSFGVDTMRSVLKNLEIQRDRSRPLRIIYMNPVFDAELKTIPWLKSEQIIRPPRRFFTTAPNWDVAIWEAT